MTPVDPAAAHQVADDASIAARFARACGIDPAAVQASRDGSGTLVVAVPVASWVSAAQYARDGLEMDFLDWLSAVDAPDSDPAGAEIVLHIASTSSAGPDGGRSRYLRRDDTPYVQRLLLTTAVPDAGSGIASLTALWPGVAWHERETFEMFGIEFTGFDDGTGQPLRPLLLPEGFEGTPLRKSFVLAARAAEAWPGAKDPADSDHSAGVAGAGRAGAAGAGRGRGGTSPSRRKTLPPGVPDPSWGPRGSAVEGGTPADSAADRGDS